jgi:hypothetical protein
MHAVKARCVWQVPALPCHRQPEDVPPARALAAACRRQAFVCVLQNEQRSRVPIARFAFRPYIVFWLARLRTTVAGRPPEAVGLVIRNSSPEIA